MTALTLEWLQNGGFSKLRQCRYCLTSVKSEDLFLDNAGSLAKYVHYLIPRRVGEITGINDSLVGT